MIRRSVRAALVATAIAVTCSACGGSGGTTSEEDPAPTVTLDDLKPTPDDFFPGFDAPDDREVSDEYDDAARLLGGSLSSILEVSFEEPSTWTLTSDKDVVGAVAAGFSAVGEAGSATLAESLLSGSKSDAVTGERVAAGYASTFAPDSQPTDMFVYKLKWDWAVDEESGKVSVTAVAWAGYEVDKRVVISARQFTLSGTDQGSTYDLSMSPPVSGGFYDLCTAVVEGVLAPDEDDLSAAEQKSLKAEFADPEFHPLSESFLAKESDDDESDGDRSQRVEACLAQG